MIATAVSPELSKRSRESRRLSTAADVMASEPEAHVVRCTLCPVPHHLATTNFGSLPIIRSPRQTCADVSCQPVSVRYRYVVLT
jgi:hypothetical protein